MFCEKCGAKNKDDSLFCEKCGNKLTADGVPSGKPQSGGTAVKINTKTVAAVLALLALAAVIFAVINGFDSGEKAVGEDVLQESDIIGKWYNGDKSTRNILLFKDNGEVRTWTEMGEFFNDGNDEGLLGGKWKLIGKNGIKITYDTDDTTIVEHYFGESGLGTVSVSDDGSEIKFLVYGKLYDRLILEKYPYTD